jgi:beta-lactamase regulating signal transducer with metallopeptidase domain
MDTLLEIVMSNAVLATLLALVVAIVTRIVRRPQLAYWLWTLVLVKLVTPPIVRVPLPFGPSEDVAAVGDEMATFEALSTDWNPSLEAEQNESARFPALPGFPPGETMSKDKVPSSSVLPVLSETSEHPEPTASATVTASEDPSPTDGEMPLRVSWTTVAVSLWLIGSISWFVLAAVRVFRFGQFVRQAELAPEHLQAAANRLGERFGLRRCPQVRVLAARIPPLLWRLKRRAVIVLPSDLLHEIGTTEQTALVAHELAHYRRGDHLIRWAEAVVLGLYWWHPVVWWARRRLHQAEELCCDAWVLWALPECAKGYAHALLTAVEYLSPQRSPLPAVTAGLGQVGPLKRRLEMIVSGNTNRRMSWVGAIVVVMAAMAVLPWSAGMSPAEDSRAELSAEADRKDASPEPPSAMDEVSPTENRSEKVRDLSLAEQIVGTVHDPDGSPVAGADVYLLDHAVMGNWVLSGKLHRYARPSEAYARWYGTGYDEMQGQARTDAKGRFVIDVEDPVAVQVSMLEEFGEAKVVAVAEGLGFTFQRLEQTGRTVEVNFRQSVPINGRLLLPDGTPAAQSLVRVITMNDPETFFRASRSVANEELPEYWPAPVRTDANGSFMLSGIPAGFRVNLAVIDPDTAFRSIHVDTGLDTTDETAADDLWVPPTFSRRLEPTTWLEGTVTAADSGQPIPGVWLAFNGGWPEHARTDDQGRYRVVIENGHCSQIIAYPPPDSGYLSDYVEDVFWPSGSKRVADFTLDRGKLIRGRVVDGESDRPIPGASVAYRPSTINFFRKSKYVFGYNNPALTDSDGRFTVTAFSGPGYLLVETPDRSYLRSLDVGLMQGTGFAGQRTMPMGLTPVNVPLLGTLKEEVTIRLERGRTVELRAVGPEGEPLPWVHATWEGVDAAHRYVWNRGFTFPNGKVVVPGLEPSRTARVFLMYQPDNLGVAYDITSDSEDGPIDVRLQPAATVVGRTVTGAGSPAEECVYRLYMTFDPEASERTAEDERNFGFYTYYARESKGLLHAHYPSGRFTLQPVVAGIPLELEVKDRRGNTVNRMAIEPLKPGERRDLGDVVAGEPRADGGQVALEVKPFREATRAGGELKFVQGIPVLFVGGTPEDMGRQQAELVEETAKPLIGLPRKIMGNPPDLLWSTMVQLGRQVLERSPERYQREAKAAIEAANLNQEEADAMIVANALLEVAGAFFCSALVVEPERSASGQMLFGRNRDDWTYGVLHRLGLVTVYRPEGKHAFANVAHPIVLGVISGMNDAGLAAALMTSGRAKDDSPKLNLQGTSLLITTRQILEECATVEEAEALLRRNHYLTQMNLVVCDRHRAVVFEITPKNIVVRSSKDHLLACTNHFRSPELSIGQSCVRYQKLQNYFFKDSPLARTDVAKALHDASDGQRTIQTMIFEPQSLRLRLALGDPPTSAKPLVPLNLAELFGHDVASVPE